jgi:hypothetical protein
MYARLISFTGADPARRDQAAETIKGTVIPMLRQYDGYAGYIALYDGENNRARAIILWDSKEAAESAEQELVPRREKIAGAIGLTVESADLYEALVVDYEGARV